MTRMDTPSKRASGVIHCFYSSIEVAEQYLKLGYQICSVCTLCRDHEKARFLEGVKVGMSLWQRN